MNIRARRIHGLFILLSLIITKASAQNGDSVTVNREGEYSLVVYAGGGLTVYRGSAGVSNSVETKLNKTDIGGSLRIMWHPDHLLRLGVESGFIPFYNYKISDDQYTGKMTVTSIPMLLEWSLSIGNKVNVFVGYGFYIKKSTLDYAGITKSSSNSLGYMLAANFIQPVAPNLGIAGEVKWMDASESEDEVLLFQVSLVWRFFHW